MAALDTREVRERFLEHYAKTGRVIEACDHAGIYHREVYARRMKNPEFAEAMADARKRHRELIEKAIYRRGVIGWLEDRGVDSNGNPIRVPRHSDKLLLAYAKRWIKAYRDPEPTPISIHTSALASTAVDIEALSDLAKNHLRALIAEAAKAQLTTVPTETNGTQNGNGHVNGINGHAS